MAVFVHSTVLCHGVEGGRSGSGWKESMIGQIVPGWNGSKSKFTCFKVELHTF